MQTLFDWISTINSIVWGPWMMVLVIGTGLWLTIGTGFVQFRRFAHAIRLMLKSAAQKEKEEGIGPGEITPFQALMTALSATVGNGNIAGVATAIALGGVGAPVWMWITGLVGMATKYTEAYLGVKYRQTLPDGSLAGGSMYFLEHGLKVKWLAWLFAFFGAITALVIGNMVQANSAAAVLESELNLHPLLTGVVLAILTYAVIIGGVRRIGQVAEYLVPVMCGLYILGGVVLILIRIADVPAAFALIFKSAFTGQAAAGGFAGAGIAQAIRFGVARGIFSNEAGLGTASIVHAAAMTRDPARQGTIAILGVFVDTFLVNTITVLAIVLTGVWTSGLTSAPLTAEGFSSVLGPVGGWIVAFGSVTFAYSTLLVWAYYGLMCVEYIFGIRALFTYRWLWCLIIIIGARFSNEVAGIKFIWNLADATNGAMAIPNLVGLLGLSFLVFRGTKSYYSSGSPTD